MTTDIETGIGGGSAQREYQRRMAAYDRAVEQRWGTGFLARAVKVVAPPPQSTMAWAKGADGERRLAASLARAMADGVVALHDRRVPGTNGNIDHIVVASSGVWVVDAKNYSGKVERRDVGGWHSVDDRLYVCGLDRTSLVTGLAGQVEAVRSVVDGLAPDHTDVHCALCFTDSEWGLLAKSFWIDDVLVTHPPGLVSNLSSDGPLEPNDVRRLAVEMSTRFPPA